jgi:MraZ protein
MSLLLGKYRNKLDAKGRVILPAKLRAGLGERVVIVKGYDECLYLYEESAWLRYADEHVETKPDEDEEARAFKSMFYASSMPLEVDKQGRINIPGELIEFAGIKSEVINIGARSRIEIWAREKYESKNAGADLGNLIGNMRRYIK